MTPTKTPAQRTPRKAVKARTWDRWALVGEKRLYFVNERNISERTAAKMLFQDEELIRIRITELPPRQEGTRKAGQR